MKKQKTEEQKQEIRNRWQMRCILRKIQASLPEGYVTTNTKPVKKEISHKSSCGKSVYWSSWCKNGKIRYLALLDGEKLKLVPEKDIKTFYKIRTVA